MDNTHIMSVGVKHVDISNNSCEVKTGTSVEVKSGCVEVDEVKVDHVVRISVVLL